MPRACLPMMMLLGLSLAGSAGAQEFDRAKEPERLEGRPVDEVAPVDSRIPVSQPRSPEFVPERGIGNPAHLPDPEPGPQEPLGQDDEDRIELKLEGRARVAGGYDTNVFRSDRNRTADGFSRVSGEVELLTKFWQGSEFFVEISADTLMYFERSRANEHFVSAFAEYFQPLTNWMDAGIQNAFEFSKLNLLDDNGDLFPRGRFGSVDEEVRAFLILRPQVSDGYGDGDVGWLRDLAFELGAGYRLKDYEENGGVDSLDYEEIRLDGSVSYKFSRKPRSRLKLKYRFRRRDYRQFRARNRTGNIGPNEPHLDLQRHQINLTWFQEIRVLEKRGRVIVGFGGVYNRDLHENDRSYREGSLSLRGEWWPVQDWTRIEVSVRGVARDFIVRQPAGSGGHLRHRLMNVTVGFWQQLGRLFLLPEEPGQKESGVGVQFALFATITTTVWRSGDPNEDYDRYVFQAGLEGSF